ncbi:MAG: protein kinase, partial [Acaryochloris sp. CRU_2_0]|nr:protein kinase [Acaryochloris sp. CRU_2_0]
MSYCVNPHCEARENPDDELVCVSCGTTLLVRDRYRPVQLLSPLGGPQESEVFEVEDTTGGVGIEVGTHLIMKVLLIEDRFKLPDSKRTEFLFREVKVLKAIDHIGIPKVQKDGFFVVKDAGVDEELHCLVQEKIEGQTLNLWVEEHGPISQELALAWLGQLSDSLNELYKIGYFHRDIKPENIIRRPDGTVVLIDFGAVREVTATYLTRIGRPPDEGRYEQDLETT